jgi:superfamily I DNA/RNA helicase/mRNA-degrading endonuclease RelE of RelBE toxin-antitoxin system
MNFRIANTFTDSLAKLTSEEQKATKTTVVDLQMNPAHPGISFHKIDKAKDKNFWSVRVNKDIRIIVHKTDDSLLICYVDHHDKAYEWAQKRKLETHPTTGAAQIVEVRETVKEIEVPTYVTKKQKPEPEAPLLANCSEAQLLSYGVPSDWVSDVRNAGEERLVQLVEYLPEEAGEAVLKLATGEEPEKEEPREAESDPMDHPDAQRRFRVMDNKEALERALDYPWGQWSIFLHPAQQQLVEQHFNGPAKVSGSAGTGKTVVALHRAAHLARTNPEARVLLTTFSENLANMLRNKLDRLITANKEPRLRERLEVHSMEAIGQRLYNAKFGKAHLPTAEDVHAILKEATDKNPDNKFSLSFIKEEWEAVVDARGISSWEAYRDVSRAGRKRRIFENQRASLWQIFQNAHQKLSEEGFITQATMFNQLARDFQASNNPPFDFAVVDEAQDINLPQLKFLAAIGANRPNSLFFAGDLGQRIFQQPFSWKSLGVKIRGRSKSLKLNYRTSHQIRKQADRLLDKELADVDGNTEDRKGTVSVFNGPKPDIQIVEDNEEEAKTVADWIGGCRNEGVLPHEIGVFVRTEAELSRAKEAIQKAGYAFKLLDAKTEPKQDHVSLSTMHLAKGLEFKGVAVIACDDEVIPLQDRIEDIAEESDMAKVYNTERNLLYVACTRARDYLLVTGTDPASEFLDDLD